MDSFRPLNCFRQPNLMFCFKFTVKRNLYLFLFFNEFPQMLKEGMKKDNKKFKENDTDLQLLADTIMPVLDNNKDGKLSFQEYLCPLPKFSVDFGKKRVVISQTTVVVYNLSLKQSSFLKFLSNVLNIIRNRAATNNQLQSRQRIPDEIKVMLCLFWRHQRSSQFSRINFCAFARRLIASECQLVPIFPGRLLFEEVGKKSEQIADTKPKFCLFLEQ